MQSSRRTLLIAVVALAFAACGGGSSNASSRGGGGSTAAAGNAGGGGAAATGSVSTASGALGVKGYDCATLITPSELDAAAGLSGGTVTTTKRGDAPAPAGEVGGVTECAIDIPTVSIWTGSFAVATGDEATANFDAQMAIGKQQGATPLAGVGSEAVIHSADQMVNAWAKGSNGVDVTIGVAYDDGTTTEQAVLAAVKQILTTVLART